MSSGNILQCHQVIYYNVIGIYITMSSGYILQYHQVIYYNVIRLYTTMSSGDILQCHQVIYYNVWGPYNILWVTDRSINSHLARSAMNYLIYYTQYIQICQTICFCYCISKTKNEFRQNPEESIIFIGPGQYYTIIDFYWGLLIAMRT
jgi:hypothetical protein